MEPKYQQFRGMDGEIVTNAIMKDDAVCVAFNNGPEHKDYLDWLAEGNTPQPAD